MATHRNTWQERDLAKSARSPGEDDQGQTMAEYAVVLGVLVVACVAAFPALSAVIDGLFQTVANAIKGA